MNGAMLGVLFAKCSRKVLGMYYVLDVCRLFRIVDLEFVLQSSAHI